MWRRRNEMAAKYQCENKRINGENLAVSYGGVASKA
jgi:hypothetical protein